MKVTEKQRKEVRRHMHVSRSTHGEAVEKATVHITNVIFDLL